MTKKAALHNLGCKVNAYELEAMRQSLEEAGYEIVPFEPGADVYVINTCTVTNIADRKSRQMLHRAKKMNPEALVAAVGCYAQIRGEELKKDETIDIVIGNNRKNALVEELNRYFESGEKQAELANLTQGRDYEEMFVSRTESHTRAFIKVQDGCDQFCSYCIIPFARGRVRSRDGEDVIREALRLAESGCRELVLTGIHLCSYGRDLGLQDGLLDLIERIHEVEGIERIRLGSLEPGSISEAFVRRLSELPKICPHFHLSLQSGSDRTLERMNRRYRSGDFREAAGWFRRYYEDPALTTDIIAGFPGESEEDFRESLEFVDSCDFFETHIFPYSRREGTKAARMEGQLTDQVKRERCAALREIDERKRRAFLAGHIGQETEVLFEEQVFVGGQTWWMGHTPRYEKVLMQSPADLVNVIRRLSPSGVEFGDYLLFAGE